MKKQTKLVAVLSTAALLTIGASMTLPQLQAGQKKMVPGYTMIETVTKVTR